MFQQQRHASKHEYLPSGLVGLSASPPTLTTSYVGANRLTLTESTRAQIKDRGLQGKDFVAMVLGYQERLGYQSTSNESELAAFTAYALAFPDGFMALLDTYDTLQSGVPNFLCVALALDDLGHRFVVGFARPCGWVSRMGACLRSYVRKASPVSRGIVEDTSRSKKKYRFTVRNNVKL